MKKIKVLHIAFNDMGHGGIQACIMTVAEQLKDRIAQDVVVFSSKPAYYDEAFSKYGNIIRGKLDKLTRDVVFLGKT